MLRWITTLAAVLMPVVGWASLATGQVNRFHPKPLSNYWWFEVSPMKGKVQSFETTTQGRGYGGRPSQISFFTLPDGGRRTVIGSMQQPMATIDRNAKGQPTRIMSRGTRPVEGQQRSEPITITETPTYDADGVLTSVKIERGDEPPRTLTVKSSPAPGDGRTLSWEHELMNSTFLAELTLDANGRLVRWNNNPPGTSANPPWNFKYNAQGDAEAVEQGNNSQDLYEFTYDETGNWTRRQRFTIRGGGKEAQEVNTRKITYGDPPPAPADAPVAARLARRPPDDAAVALPPPQPGAERYRKTFGEAGSGLFSEMTLTLNPDKSGSFVVTNEFKQQRTTKAAIASWKTEGDVIVFNLERSLDGQAIPSDSRTLRFNKTAEGELTPENDPNVPFKKLTEGK